MMLLTNEEFPSTTINSHSANLFCKKITKSDKNIHPLWVTKY